MAKTVKINMLNEKIKESIDTIPQKIDDFVNKIVHKSLGIDHSFGDFRIKFDSPLAKNIKELAVPLAKELVNKYKIKLNDKQIASVEKQINESIADAIDDIITFSAKDEIKDKVFSKIDLLIDNMISKKFVKIQKDLEQRFKQALESKFELGNPEYGETALEYIMMKNQIAKELAKKEK